MLRRRSPLFDPNAIWQIPVFSKVSKAFKTLGTKLSKLGKLGNLVAMTQRANIFFRLKVLKPKKLGKLLKKKGKKWAKLAHRDLWANLRSLLISVSFYF